MTKAYRLRVAAETDPEKLTLTTYAASFLDPSTMVGLPVQNGLVDGFADYTITLDEPASARTHYLVDNGEVLDMTEDGFVSMKFISTSANIALSVTYQAGETAALPLPLWRVAGQVDQSSATFTQSNPTNEAITIELIIPDSVEGASLLAQDAKVVHWVQSDITTQLTTVNFSLNSLNQPSVDALLSWVANESNTVATMDLSGVNMSPPSSESCLTLDALANRLVNLDHQPMLEPCPAYIQATVNTAGVLVYNMMDYDWPVLEGTTLAINADGELVATGDAANYLSIAADGNLVITAPLEELATQ